MGDGLIKKRRLAGEVRYVGEKLKFRQADGFGFLYCNAWVNGEPVRVDVLPPEHLWRRDIKFDGHRPDPKAWIVYMNGEEFARVERREDLASVLSLEGRPRARGLLSRVRGLRGGR